MAKDRNVSFILSANIKNFKDNLSKAQKKFRRFGRKMKRAGRNMTQNITLPLAAVSGASLKAAADFEKLEQSMIALNGSVKKGTEQFERLKRFSANTPFQLKDLADAQNMLQGFDLSAKSAFESMQMIGDISAITGGDIKAIGVAFGQASAEGRVMSRDLRQFINQGVPIIGMLADSMGVAKDQIFDLASQGEISFSDLQKSFREATSEGGRFANGMEKQAKTLWGLWSTIKDNFTIALGEIGTSLAETFDIKALANDLIANVKGAINWFNSLSAQTRSMAFKVGGLLGATGPILTAVSVLISTLGTLSWPVVLGVAGFAGAIGAMIEHWDEITSYFKQGAGAEMWASIKEAGASLFKTLKGFFRSTVDLVKGIWSQFGDDIITITETSFELIAKIIEATFDTIGFTLDLFTLAFTGDWDSFLSKNENRAKRFRENVQDALDFSNIEILGIPVGKIAKYISGPQNIDKALGTQIVDLKKLNSEVAKTPQIFRQAKNPVAGFWNNLKKSTEKGAGVFRTKTQQMIDDVLRLQQFLSKDLSFEGSRSSEKSFKGADNPIKSAGLDFTQGMFGGMGDKFSGWITGEIDNLTYLEETIKNVGSSYKTQLGGMMTSSSKFASVTEAAGIKSLSGWQQFRVDFMNTGQMLKEFMAGQLANAFQNLGNTIGKSLSGADKGWKTGFEKIISIALSFVKQLGQILIGMGSALLPTGIFSGKGLLYIGAGTALMALSSGFQAGINKRAQNRQERGENNIPQMADGGIVPAGFPNDSYPAFLSSGERVVPPHELDKMGSGLDMSKGTMRQAFSEALAGASLKASGSDLQLVLNNVGYTTR